MTTKTEQKPMTFAEASANLDSLRERLRDGDTSVTAAMLEHATLALEAAQRRETAEAEINAARAERERQEKLTELLAEADTRCMVAELDQAGAAIGQVVRRYLDLSAQARQARAAYLTELRNLAPPQEFPNGPRLELTDGVVIRNGNELFLRGERIATPGYGDSVDAIVGETVRRWKPQS